MENPIIQNIFAQYGNEIYNNSGSGAPYTVEVIKTVLDKIESKDYFKLAPYLVRGGTCPFSTAFFSIPSFWNTWTDKEWAYVLAHTKRNHFDRNIMSDSTCDDLILCCNVLQIDAFQLLWDSEWRHKKEVEDIALFMEPRRFTYPDFSFWEEHYTEDWAELKKHVLAYQAHFFATYGEKYRLPVSWDMPEEERIEFYKRHAKKFVSKFGAIITAQVEKEEAAMNEQLMQRINEIKDIAKQRLLLAREQFEMDILQQLHDTDDEDVMKNLRRLLNETPTDETLRKQLWDKVKRKYELLDYDIFEKF
jgi:hypothetical protein